MLNAQSKEEGMRTRGDTLRDDVTERVTIKQQSSNNRSWRDGPTLMSGRLSRGTRTQAKQRPSVIADICRCEKRHQNEDCPQAHHLSSLSTTDKTVRSI